MQRHPTLSGDARHQHAVVAKGREVFLFCDFGARCGGKLVGLDSSAEREHVSNHVVKDADLGEQTRAVVLQAAKVRA